MELDAIKILIHEAQGSLDISVTVKYLILVVKVNILDNMSFNKYIIIHEI